MAQELTLNGQLAYDDGFSSPSMKLDDFVANVGTKKFAHNKVSVGTSEEAIPLGEVTALGWAMFANYDDTNYVEIRFASGASNDHIKIPPGAKVGPFHFGSDVTAPYWVANTGACLCEALIVSQ